MQQREFKVREREIRDRTTKAKNSQPVVNQIKGKKDNKRTQSKAVRFLQAYAK